MAWQERDYHKGDWRGRFEAMGLSRPPAATLGLLIAHGAAFVIVLAAPSGAFANLDWLAARLDPRVDPLGIPLHPFISGNFLSVLFTALGLWVLGARLEPTLGPARLLTHYAAATLTSGAAYCLLAQLNAEAVRRPLDYPVGALAGLCVCAARELAGETVNVFGRWMRVTHVYLWCAGVVLLLAIAADGRGAAGFLLAAAVGAGTSGALPAVLGAAAGLWTGRPTGAGGASAGGRGDARRGGGVSRSRDDRGALARGSSAVRSSPRSGAPARPAPPQSEVLDRLLAKISREGLGALSDEERVALDRERERLQRTGDGGR